jgi:peptide/nickel transport system permease protein
VSVTFARRLTRRPIAIIALVFLAVVVVGCVAAPLLAPDDPLAQQLTAIQQGPSSAHLLGTDSLGRDVLSRLMYGGRVTLLGALEAVVVFVALGVPLGLLSGYLGGRFDAVASRVAEVMLSIPAIIFLLVVVAVFPGSQLATMVTLGVLGAPSLFRVVRGSTRALTEELYVRAARTMGLTTPQVLRRHIVPMLAGPIIVQASLFAATAVLTDSALAFLGFSVQPPEPSWGGMVAEASMVIDADPWLLVPPGLAIGLVVLALVLVGDAARDIVTEVPGAPAPRRPGPPAPPAAVAVPEAVTPSDALLSVRGLSIAFPAPGGAVTVVRDVSFDVQPGQAVGLVGESGCGKTVVARALLGLLPGDGRVVGGSITFSGRELVALTERERAAMRGAQIGLVPQDPVATLDPAFTIGRQLAEVVRRHERCGRREAAARVRELLAMVELADPQRVAARYPHELSGGMAQRVAIALALAGEPQLLIADEPTTALDMTVQAEVLALLRRLREQLGMAMVLVTHDWGVLADSCDAAVVMYAGEVVERAAVEPLFADARHPYTRALIASNPVFAAPGEPLPAIDGQVPAPADWPHGCHFAPRCALALDACREAPVTLEDDGGHATRCLRAGELVTDAARVVGRGADE